MEHTKWEIYWDLRRHCIAFPKDQDAKVKLAKLFKSLHKDLRWYPA